jgi:hypothetical protein
MNRLNMTDVRCAALFASGLQQSDAPTGALAQSDLARSILARSDLAPEGAAPRSQFDSQLGGGLWDTWQRWRLDAGRRLWRCTRRAAARR